MRDWLIAYFNSLWDLTMSLSSETWERHEAQKALVAIAYATLTDTEYQAFMDTPRS